MCRTQTHQDATQDALAKGQHKEKRFEKLNVRCLTQNRGERKSQKDNGQQTEKLLYLEKKEDKGSERRSPVKNDKIGR